MVLNVKDLLAKAKVTENAPVAVKHENTGHSKPGFGVVFNRNSKRLSFTKGLAEPLGLKETVDIFPLVEEGVILIASRLALEGVSSGKVCGEGKKISYSAPLVEMIVNAFELDYNACSSKSFDNISFEDFDGVKVAAVKIK